MKNGQPEVICVIAALITLLLLIRGCQDYDLDARCIEATGAVCVHQQLL